MNGGNQRLQAAARVAAWAALAAAFLVPLTGSAQLTDRGRVVKATMPASVFVLAAEKTADGRLQPVASGSGTIVSSDGSVLTNFHVINNQPKSRLFDAVAIGLFRAADQEPELICLANPAAGKIKPELDLALLKCEMGIDGRPLQALSWPTIPLGKSRDLVPGEEVIVIGYPGVGGNTIHVTSGRISGWTGERIGTSRAFIKTDAAIAHGNSGGTAIDAAGNLIGVPTAFRIDTEGDTDQVVGKVGLIRPIDLADDLVSLAQAGWKPTLGSNGVPAGPPEGAPVPPAAGPGGVTVYSRVLDTSNGEPVRGAFVVALKPEITRSQLDVNKLAEQALSYGQTNSRGEFTMQPPIPRGKTYTVLVAAEGYRPLIEDGVLELDASSPSRFDPWGEIRIDRE